MGRDGVPLPPGARAAGLLGAGLLRVLGATWRVRVIGRDEELALRVARRPILYAFWHGELLPLAYLMRDMDATVMVSEHRDGEYITQVISRLGFRAVRGSTTRGGYRSLLALARRGRAGELIAITPDGPRGPRHKAQIGALLAAQRAGAPIIPVAARLSRARRLASWDEFLIPAPFARATLAFGPAWQVPAGLRPAELAERWLPRLEEALNATGAAAARALSAWERERWPLAARAGLGLYDLAWAAGLLAASPYVALRALIHPAEMSERCGRRDPRAGQAAGGLWLHCASLGEVRGALPLLRGLAARGEAPLVTTVTPAARAQAAEIRAAGASDVRHAPLDFRPVAGRAVARQCPRALLIFETEIWPGLLAGALDRGVPVAFVNARLTERGLRRWRCGPARPLARALLARVWVAAQSEADAQRWRALGAPAERVRVTGNTKYQQPRGPLAPERRAALRGGWRTLIVFGSVRSSEAEAVAEALRACRGAVPGPALFVLAPRHRESAGRIVAAASRVMGRAIVRATAAAPLLPDAADANASQVLLHVDTVGELRQFYAVADVAFVGATLCPIGGHNLFEAAELGVPVVHGPHTANVADVAAALADAGGAFRVADGPELGARVSALASGEPERQAAAEGALRAAATLGGAVERTLAALEAWGVPIART